MIQATASCVSAALSTAQSILASTGAATAYKPEIRFYSIWIALSRNSSVLAAAFRRRALPNRQFADINGLAGAEPGNLCTLKTDAASPDFFGALYVQRQEREFVTECIGKRRYYATEGTKGARSNMIFGFGRNGIPESNTGKTLVVNQRRCPQNHACPAVPVCPAGALSQDGFAAPSVNQEKCIRCGKCVAFCPMRALTLK